MPGNEFGERIHNFFGQEGLSQGQHQSQVVDGSWPGFSNGLLVGSQRQLDSSIISNLKNYSARQAVDSERGPSSSAQHGLNFAQQQIRPDFSRSQSQSHQQTVNGYIHGNQVFQSMQNEANFLGMDAESDGHRLTLKGVPPDLHRIPMRLETGESPVNYDFFGGQQQQISSQVPGMLQSFPRQQMGINDMRLLQQQVMLKQMHEYQRQEQLQKQQLEARQLNSLNQVAANGNRFGENHMHPLFAGVPLHDASNNSWQPELIGANSNWVNRGVSPVGQGSSTALMFNPEQGQMNLMGLVPHQFEQSLYGVPVSGTGGQQDAFSSIQMNKLSMHHVPPSSNSSLVNQQAAFSSQDDMRDSAMLPRPSFQEKLLFSHTSVEGSSNGLRFENLLQVDSPERNVSVPEKFSEKLDATGPLEKSHVKMTEIVTSSQHVATLDPTEEKILFGSDDNLWDAFGNSTSMSLVGNISSGSEPLGSFPSLQSGSWSALMQSAVAETSSGDAGVQERSGKQQSVWADSTTRTPVNSHSGIGAQNLGFKASNAQNLSVHTDAAQTAVQYFQDKGSNVIDGSLLEKPMAEHSQMAGSIFHSSGSDFNGQSISCSAQENKGIGGRLGIWKAASNSNSTVPMEHKNFFARNLKTQRTSSGFASAGAINDSIAVRDAQRNIQQHLTSDFVNKAIPQLNSRDSNQTVESSASDDAGKMAVETNEMGSSTKENSSDSFRSNLSPQISVGGFRGSTQVNARDASLPSGKQKQSGHIGRRPSIPRKFQYHPMGDIVVTEEPSRDKVMHSQPMFQQVSGGNQGYFNHSKPLGETARNMGIEKGQIPQGDSNRANEASNKGIYPDYSPSTSTSIDRTVDGCNKVNTASSRQTMLELLDKVDQSQEHSMGTRASGLCEAETSAGSGVPPQRNQSSASKGFTLQLGPPSQPVLSPDNIPFPQSSLHAVNFSNSQNPASEKGGMIQSRLAQWASNQSFLHHHAHQGAFSGIPGQTNSNPVFLYSKGYHQNQQMAVASGQLASNRSVNLSSERSATQNNERDEYGETAQGRQSAQITSQLSHNTHVHRGDSTEGFPILEAMPASQPLVSFSTSEQGHSSVPMSGSPAHISMVQHQLLTQPSKPHSHLWSSNNLEKSFAGQEKTNQTSQNGRDGSPAGRGMMNMLESQDKDLAAQNQSHASSLFPKMAQGNFQTFGQSITPNNFSKEKSSLHWDLTPRYGEYDSADRTVRRVKDRDRGVDPQQVAPVGDQQSPSGSDGLVRDGSFNHKASANVLPPFSQNVSKSSTNRSLITPSGEDCPQVSPQMAPSWFSQHGSFKNGQLMPLNDVGRSALSKIAEQSSIVGRSFDALHSDQAVKQVNAADQGQLVNVQQSSGTMPGAGSIASPGLLPRAATDQLVAVDRPKKRKTATSGLLSWSKEVVQGSQRLQTLSEAEVEWARATNRFAEKLEVEAELLEDVSPVLRSKRRLILTTQLMQQLFSPPPARVMSLAASADCESVGYAAARAALGDACSSGSSTGRETEPPISSANPLSSEKTKTAEKISDQYISKAAEDLTSRAQKLEGDLARLEKGTTIPDVRLEVQDLEKFSVINRFAKFHARGQGDGTEMPPSSSSSGDGTSNPLVRPYPQRYVTAHPMPRNVPDRVHCLSL